MLLQNCRYVVTQDKERSILENVDILIEGNTISQIGKGLQTKESEVIDCSSRIVLPGLINAHMHLGMTALRGCSDDRELREWLDEVIVNEQAMGAKEFFESCVLGLKEAIRTGTTTSVDMYSPIAPAMEAAKSVGARLLAFKSYFTEHEQEPEDILATLPERSSCTERISLGLGPHSIYGCSEEFLVNIKNFAKEHGLPLTIHVSETRKERAEAKRDRGKLPIEYLDDIGFLDSTVLLVHCAWLTKGELDRIARSGAKIVHCPQSNMKLAGGSTMPLKEMKERGIQVSLGTDSAVSNNSLDMFREMHVAALLHKHHYWDPTVISAQDVLDMATRGGANAIGKKDILGSIEQGKLADIITLDIRAENLQPVSAKRLVSHIVYSANGMNVKETIVDGTLLLKDGVFQ